MKLDGLILAAGNSSRFGGCKLLANWQGKPVLDRVIDVTQSLPLERLAVVTGAYHRDIADYFNNRTLELFYCADWQVGMGNSLAYGVSQLPPENAVLVLLGDQPLIDTDDLQQLLTTWKANPHKITCAAFASTRGVPAIFPATAKPWLLQLSGDRGAKGLLNGSDVCAVPMPNAAFDVDTRSDLLHVKQG
jgi:molybdenum cofactor cytidylyltransferase